MIHIDNYCRKNNIARKTVERMLIKRKIKAIKVKGRTYILEPNPTHYNEEYIKNFISRIKKQAERGQVKEALERVRQFESMTGLKLRGVSYKTLWAISTGRRKAGRKTRSDKMTIRNKILSEQGWLEKLYKIAIKYYISGAKENYLLTTHLVMRECQSKQDLWELASVPESTLYKTIKRLLTERGINRVHQYINHKNLFENTLPTMRGAFTDGELKYMDCIIGDDHETDISDVYIYDDKKRKIIKKSIRIWWWVEAVTMQPLAFHITTEPITARDAIKTLIEAITNNGLPGKYILVDNGIANSETFKKYAPDFYKYFSEIIKKSK